MLKHPCVPGNNVPEWSSLTWLFNNKQDRFATGVLIVLEPLHTIILIFVGTVHSICIVEHCKNNKEKIDKSSL